MSSDVVVDANENLLCKDSTSGTVAWLKKHLEPGRTVIVGETGERLTPFEYLEKFDPNYASWNGLESTRSYDGGDDDE